MKEQLKPLKFLDGARIGGAEDASEVLKVKKPIRSQVLTRDGLTERGLIIAEQDSVIPSSRRSVELRSRFEDNCKVLERAYLTLAEAGRNKEVLDPGAEWLLDNYHIVQQHVIEVKKYFPKGYDRTLPKLTSGDLEGYPRVYRIALDLVAHTDALIDTDLLSAYVKGYQTRTQLTSGEVWAVPIMLKFALIENLRRLLEAIIVARDRKLDVQSLVGELFVSKPEKERSTDLLLVLARSVDAHPSLLQTGAVHLLRRLREQAQRAPLALRWFEERLREQGIEPDALIREYHHQQALDQVSIGNSITSLRTLSGINWRQWFEDMSALDAVLRRDPAGLYHLCDFETRDHYRHQIERYSRWSGLSETKVAEHIIALAQEARARSSVPPQTDPESHVGYYLVGDRGPEALEERMQALLPVAEVFRRTLKRHGFAFYLSGMVVLTLGLLLFATFYSAQFGGSVFLCTLLAITFFIPATDVASNFMQWFINHVTTPTRLPKLHLEGGVPDEKRTLITVHGIFYDTDSLERAAEALEVRFLGNDDPNLFYAILADLRDRTEREAPASDYEIVQFAKDLVAKLNDRYPSEGAPRFLILFRTRLWNESEQKLMGWERKRGKVEEINRLILGEPGTSFEVTEAERAFLKTIRYVITLDGDSQLPSGTAKKLIGTISHPLNAPHIDQETGLVRKGYGIVQPRVSVALRSANATRFARIFSGHSGLDPYTQTVSDFYQDLFDEGSFVGKGIYDVRAFAHALHGRVPENALLSHDLFEGFFARVALASDIELFDEFPTRYNVYAKRQHRWVRGDWQLLPWLSPRVPSVHGPQRNPLHALGKWKLFDNLRRSLVAPTLLLFLTLAFVALPGSPLFWLSLAILVVAFPIYAHVAAVFIIPPLGLSLSTYAKGLGSDLLKHSQQAAYSFAFLPHQAYLMLHAIGVTLYRLYISKRHLLEWETAYHSELRLGSDLGSFLRQMKPALAVSVGIGVLALLLSPSALIVLLPFLSSWIAAPYIATKLSEPMPRRGGELDARMRSYLEQLAYDTWRYFRDHLIAEHNYLIPDNLQLTPHRVLAPRTSPTNISIAMLSTIGAYELGFEPLTTPLDLLSKTTHSLEKLERFNGHFLNWYDTTNLQPLHPRYVSTVDSGNFAGLLIAMQQWLVTAPTLPLVSPALQGHVIESLHSHFRRTGEHTVETASNRLRECTGFTIRETGKYLSTLREAIADIPATDAEQLKHSFPELRNLELLASVFEFVSWLDTENSDSVIGELVSRAPTLEHLDAVLTYAESLGVGDTHQQSSLRAARATLASLDRNRVWLTETFNRYLEEIDFRFLYEEGRALFPVGYNVDNARKDAGYYDLLASEARLASLVAIAKGDAPQKHWFSLGRSLADTAGGKALLSWSGTMFEYLMPLLVMKNFEPTLLSETYRAVVEAQRRYGERRKVPWGISESAYSGVDFHSTYQYRAFGVPGLGLKRGLENDLVVSPYSTVLALMITPERALTNLEALEREGARGEYGFFEAIDYTADRLSANISKHVVKSFFAHHQGMSFISIANVLRNGVFQDLFHSDPRIQSAELMLHERFPQRIPLSEPHQAAIAFVEKQMEEEQVSRGRVLTTPHTTIPVTHLLSNGRFTTMIDNSGSGFSLFDREIFLTRWREDGVVNDRGYYIFIRDLDSGKVWSVGYQPTRAEPDVYEVYFNADKVEIKRRDAKILVYAEITVAQEDNTDVRRLTITNLSTKKRNLEVTTYAEVALAPQRADTAHPAFSKMFIESEFDAEHDTLTFARRPRSVHEEPLFLFHSLTMKTCWAPTQFETSRTHFIGRGRRIHDPAAFERPSLAGTSGLVLDPVMSLRTRVELEAGQSEILAFSTGVAKSREELRDVILRYRDLHHVTRAFELAWSQSSVELRNEQFTNRQTHAFQTLGTAVLFSLDALRAKPDVIERNRLHQSALWRFGISGDLPIVLLRVGDPGQLRVVRETLLAHHYLVSRGLSIDLVIVNEYPGGYFQHLQEELENLLRTGPRSGMVEKKGGIFLRALSQLSPEEFTLLQALARVVLDAAAGSLEKQLAAGEHYREYVATPPALLNYGREVESKATEASLDNPEFETTYGGFVEGGRTYGVKVHGGALPPLPWSNVIANPHFGAVVTESGAGYTWSDNSRENRLTPWSNDPASDPLGEVVYIRDTESGMYWTPTPRPVVTGGHYVVEHGFGYSRFSSEWQGIHSRLTISLAGDEKLKWYQLTLTNRDRVQRRLELYLYVDFVLGVAREDSYRHTITRFDPESQSLYAVNHYNNEFAGRCAFIGSSLNVVSFTCDRAEFIGRNRDLSCPLALDAAGALRVANFRGARRNLVRLSQREGAGLDHCGVIKVLLNLEPGEERSTLFYLGEAPSLEAIRVNASRYRSSRSHSFELEGTREFWRSLTSSVEVSTPSRSFDILMNGWLVYQTVACRLFGRTGFYQSGGAFGFRDQLQDVLALLPLRPELARAQILLHASRQFVEGDVQHWWHPPTGRGVRTKISDDYLWLPYVVCRYVETTGDYSILDEEVFYLEGPPLGDQHEAYIVPHRSSHSGTIYEHCVKAIERSAATGVHGLPLIGCGDWNDGMNEVGKDGKGESVWLGWFIYLVLRRFSALAESRDGSKAKIWTRRAESLLDAIESNAWDGRWYRRAYFDDGTPLGSATNDECRIDSLSQTWGIISGGGDPDRARIAMEEVYTRLVDREHKVIKLLAPPFDKGKMNPGYIKGYLPGIRENGGQYTHAGAWVVIATTMLGEGRLAFELFQLMNPINHTRTDEGVETYQGEPYAMCGDVYAVEPHEGRAGWSWYTGSAGWLYQAGLEHLLGFRVYSDHLTVDPCIPPEWEGFEIRYTRERAIYRIRVKNPEHVSRGVKQVVINGSVADDKKIPLSHEATTTTAVEIVLARGA